MNSNRDYYLLALACTSEHCPEKSEHAHTILMKIFTMNLDFLEYKLSVGHVKVLKFLVLHGIRIFHIFVELNFHTKEVQWRDKFDV